MSTCKLKRALAVSIAALLSVSMSACSGESASSAASSGSSVSSEPSAASGASSASGTLKAENGAQIELAYAAGSPGEASAWEQILKDFQKAHPEIKLKYQNYPSASYFSQMDTRISGSDWPDIIRYPYQRLGKFKENNVMLDLTDRISKESQDDLEPAYRAAMTYEGKLLGMPQHTDTIALYYNKAMFQKSGVRIPKGATDGWSWSELTEIAKKLKADNNLQYAFAGIWENMSGYRFLPFAYMNGGAVLSDDGTKVTVTTAQFSQAVQLYESWRKDNLIAPISMTQPAQANMMFVAKKLAFVFAGSWHLSYMDQNMPNGWDVTYMPQVNGKTGSDMGGNGIFAYKGTKYPNACTIFIDYLTSKAGMKEFCEAGNFIPVRKSLVSEGLNYSKYQTQMKVFLNIAGTIDSKLAQDETSPHFQQLNEIWCKEMDPMIVNGSESSSQVIQNLQNKMTAVLSE